MQPVHAEDPDGIGTGTLDVGAHGVEEVGKVNDVRLLGGVFDDGGALGQHRGHHNVHRGTHGDHVQIDGRALQTPAFGGGVDEVALPDTSAPMVVKPLMCWSMGRTPPKLQPPGMATVASPKRPSSAPMR